MPEPVKVAVLGGGAASMAAAFELSRTKELRDRFEVTVYQQGWRLGGKGASGRDAGSHERIEEHGLHIWFGFYRNAFELMGACFEENAKSGVKSPFASIPDGFFPCEELVLCEDLGPNGWDPVCLPLPAAPGEDEDRTLSWLPKYLVRLVRHLLDEWIEVGDRHEESEPVRREAVNRALVALNTAESKAEEQAALDEPEEELYEGVADDLEEVVDALDAAVLAAPMADFAKAVLAVLAKDVIPAYKDKYPDPARPAPFDVLNDLELREALGKSRLGGRLGAKPETLDRCFVRVLYDLAFGYVGGQGRGNLAAGMALENLISIALRHRGELMRKMKAGMGDVVFAPLYQALDARGVRFEFFSAVDSLKQSGGQVSEIGVTRQAIPGPDGYEPLITIESEGFPSGIPVWPNRPITKGLDEESRKKADALDPPVAFERERDPLGLDKRRVLMREEDFDAVVLGIPVGCLPGIAGPLLDADARLKDMVDSAPTVATQAFQLWTGRNRSGLGWPCGGGSAHAIAGGYAKPFDTYCDMSHLLTAECWPAPEPAHIAYFCGVMPDSEANRGWKDADKQAGVNAEKFLKDHMALEPGQRPFWKDFKPEDLNDGANRPSWGRMKAQYWRANAVPAERYSASPAGSLGVRLRPGDTKFKNLALAGDWTYTAINAGAVEAAVMSGREAAGVLMDEYGPPGARPEIHLPPWRRP